MNILKTLRRPSFSSFLAFLVLFSSCSKPSDLEDLEILTIERYVEIHIILTNKIAEIYSQEENVNTEMLLSSTDKFDNADQLREFLQNANFTQSSQLTDLYMKLQSNTNNYLNNLVNPNQEEIVNLITAEVNRQFEANDLEVKGALSSRSDLCGDAFRRARSRCARNYAIGSAAVIVGSIISLGWGTAFGVAAVITSGALCYEDASSDFARCII